MSKLATGCPSSASLLTSSSTASETWVYTSEGQSAERSMGIDEWGDVWESPVKEVEVGEDTVML